MKTTIAALTVPFALAAPASASVAIINSAPFVTTSGSSSYSFAFTPGAGSTKLVVSLAAELNGGSGATGFDSVSFTPDSTGVAQQLTSVASSTATRISSIYFADLAVAEAGSITVTIANGNTNGLGLGAFALSGAAAGNPFDTLEATVAAPGSTGISGTIDSVTDGLLISSYAANGATAGSPATMSTDGSTDLFGANVGSAEGAAASRALSVDGTDAATVSYVGGRDLPTSNDITLTAAVFAPVPEPSTAVLAALGMLGIFRRRR